ncbi:MAG TPA: outer membrane beta-barrel protein, partial [Woeseiaceae bacterium]|nr:outer membrane beta-barrel protein [Woeseiaceae bacterium]
TAPVSVVRFSFDVLAEADEAMLADADNDGVPDASDDQDGRKGAANRLPAKSIAPIEAEAGLRLQLGNTARSAQADSALVTPADIAAAGETDSGDDEFEYLGGIYDFEITNLPEAGSVVRVVVPQASPIGGSPEYRKFMSGAGWSAFVQDENDTIASAPDSNNACPPPGDDAYQPGLTPGDLCIELSIEDGGPNDGDAADGPNGIVKDPGGVGTPKGEIVAGQGSGAAGPVALLALALLVVWSICRRRQLRARRWHLLARGGLARGTGIAVLACAALAAPARARADAFVGAGAGVSVLSPETSNTPFSVSDNGDFGYTVFGGLDLTPLSPNLSVEAFWADLGETGFGNRGTLEYSVYGAGLLYGIGSVKAPRVSASVELGLAQLDIGGDVPFRQEKDTSAFLGLAGSFAVSRNVFLQLEYDYYAEDAQFISLSVVRRFRGIGESDVHTMPLPRP